MIEPPEVFVFGPYITNMFGKPGHAHAQVRVGAAGPALAQAHARPAPVICIGNMKSLVLKPVAQMTQSTSCTRPSAVTGPRLGELRDRLGDQAHVGPLQRRQEVGAEDHPLAAELVVGPHPPADVAGPSAASA